MGSMLQAVGRSVGILAVAGLLLAPGPWAAVAREAPYCGMLPPSVAGSTYAGYGACWLHRVGMKPLWRGLARPGYRQQIRFTFTEGHGRYVRVIDFVELASGEGRIEVTTITPTRGGLDRTGARRAPVSREEVRKLNQLAEASGTFEMEVGSWDGEEVFLHCQTLDMERIDRAGYRSSSVNISCNRPERLMPFVEHLTGLAGAKEEGGLF